MKGGVRKAAATSPHSTRPLVTFTILAQPGPPSLNSSQPLFLRTFVSCHKGQRLLSLRSNFFLAFTGCLWKASQSFDGLVSTISLRHREVGSHGREECRSVLLVICDHDEAIVGLPALSIEEVPSATTISRKTFSPWIFPVTLSKSSQRRARSTISAVCQQSAHRF